MEKRDFGKELLHFGIGVANYPAYTDAETFSRGFVKCSVLKETAVCYSSNTTNTNSCWPEVTKTHA